MTKEADVLVIGAGIAGLQAALDLADQDKKVILVDKDPSIGGRMINLSKVFPTLDCASCITTPKMSSTAHHDNIEIFTYTEVESVSKVENKFQATIAKKPRYLDEEDCIGCKRCEEVCPIFFPDEYEHGLGSRKAIYIPFTNAIPQYPVLDIDHCIMCGACSKACPTGCINYLQEPQTIEIEVGSVIVSTGFQLTPADAKSQYGAGQYPNVITALQTERLLAPHGPYGSVLRPSDGMIPDSIAFIQCAGSRDKSLGVSYCSRVCCMYAIKQAMLLSGSLPIADITIYYMDIRAFGKGYEQFYQNAKAMGIEFVKAKVAKITEDEDHNLTLRIERIEDGGTVDEVNHDLVVLSLGLLPHWHHDDVTKVLRISCDTDGFIKSTDPKISPALTNIDGIFAAGAAIGPKDIVDSIIDASTAAMEASNYLHKHGL